MTRIVELRLLHCLNHAVRGPSDAIWGAAVTREEDPAQTQLVTFWGRRTATLKKIKRESMSYGQATIALNGRVRAKMAEGYRAVDPFAATFEMAPTYGSIGTLPDQPSVGPTMVWVWAPSASASAAPAPRPILVPGAVRITPAPDACQDCGHTAGRHGITRCFDCTCRTSRSQVRATNATTRAPSSASAWTDPRCPDCSHEAAVHDSIGCRRMNCRCATNREEVLRSGQTVNDSPTVACFVCEHRRNRHMPPGCMEPNCACTRTESSVLDTVLRPGTDMAVWAKRKCLTCAHDRGTHGDDGCGSCAGRCPRTFEMGMAPACRCAHVAAAHDSGGCTVPLTNGVMCPCTRPKEAFGKKSIEPRVVKQSLIPNCSCGHTQLVHDGAGCTLMRSSGVGCGCTRAVPLAADTTVLCQCGHPVDRHNRDGCPERPCPCSRRYRKVRQAPIEAQHEPDLPSFRTGQRRRNFQL